MSNQRNYQVSVKFGDTDCTGRVYFAKYLEWIDDAVIEYFRARGITYTSRGMMKVKGEDWKDAFAIGEYHCRVHRPSGYDDKMVVRVRLQEMKAKTLTMQGEVYAADGGTLLASGWITYVYINLQQMKAQEIPERIRQLFAALQPVPDATGSS